MLCHIHAHPLYSLAHLFTLIATYRCTGNHDFGDGPNTAACDLHSVAPVLSTMIGDKINYLWSSGKILDARAFTALKPWLMRGLPTSGKTDRGREGASSDEDGGESKAGSGSGGECGDRMRGGGKHGLAAARELFRWRDDATEAAETIRTGVGLLFWSSLNNNVEAVLELAKEAAANTNQGGGNESNNTLRVNRPDLFGIFLKGLTALHMAASFASWPVVTALLEMGANTTAKVVNGMDPLMCMAMFGRADNITRWCERLPTWNFSRRNRAIGLTALGHAVVFGPNKLETVTALVEAGANPLELQADVGATCLHMVANNKDADEELVRYLLELPGVRALINTQQRGRTMKWKVTYLAARCMVKLGTRKALLVKISEWPKSTALMAAARSGNVAVMKVLVEEGGADTQLQNARGHTALDMLVGGANELEEIRVLLGGGGRGVPF